MRHFRRPDPAGVIFESIGAFIGLIVRIAIITAVVIVVFKFIV